MQMETLIIHQAVVSGQGEDSFAVSKTDGKLLLCAADGCGGLGSKRYACGSTGARLASLTAAETIQGWERITDIPPDGDAARFWLDELQFLLDNAFRQTAEEHCKEDFDEINNQLFEDAWRAHAYANTLGPIIQNIGNILYVLVAVIGGVFLLTDIPNISISGMAFEISIIIPFLNMAKQFTGNINQASQQINSVVMGMAGASRVFDVIDAKPEADDGYVTLVNAEIDEKGNITETQKRTGKWAWKHPHSDGTITYTELKTAYKRAVFKNPE